MYDTGAPLQRAVVESVRAREEREAANYYQRSKANIEEAGRAATAGDLDALWRLRNLALAYQAAGDQHAHTEHVLSDLLNPPAVATYRDAPTNAATIPVHDHTGDHPDADGADGRDAHAS